MIVSFTDYVPTPRYDSLPWTVMQVEESVSADGPWTLIDTVNLAPLDADPSQPQARSFTTHNAQIANGWYRISFKDAAGTTTYADPVQNVPSAEQPWLPTVRDVGLKLLSRTTDQYGNKLGTFTSTTEPTEADVLGIIRQAALDVADDVGDDIPEGLHDDAANLVALKAAIQIEESYFSEQVNTGRSIHPQLEKNYDRDLVRLQRQATLAREGQTSVTDAGPGSSPAYSFPDSMSIMDRRF